MESFEPPEYLAPYLDAARRHGGGFESLLWASHATQAHRFDAMLRLVQFDRRIVLDVGCGRADLLDYLIERGIWPKRYIGMEAVAPLAAAAAAKEQPDAEIIRADFVLDSRAMEVGADVIVCSGSLNTLDTRTFYATIRDAFAAAGEALVFNFLCSPHLAGRPYLRWHGSEEVLRVCGQMCPDVRELGEYLDGDCTMAMRKSARAPE